MVSFVLPLLFAVLYLGVQVYLVWKRLSTKWPLGDLALAMLFFLLSQAFTFLLSERICESTRHLIDGNFFGCLCLCVTVMMIYKYWDTVTEDEDEVGVIGRDDDWYVDEAALQWTDFKAEKQQQEQQQQFTIVHPMDSFATRVPTGDYN